MSSFMNLGTSDYDFFYFDNIATTILCETVCKGNYKSIICFFDKSNFNGKHHSQIDLL